MQFSGALSSDKARLLYFGEAAAKRKRSRARSLFLTDEANLFWSSEHHKQRRRLGFTGFNAGTVMMSTYLNIDSSGDPSV